MAQLLHIQILEYLQQSNAIGAMVNIKPAFESELDSTLKRKALKAEIDFLIKEKLVDSIGRFDFLNWELIDGLYPIDNKKIELKLAGNWQNYLAAKGGGRGGRRPSARPASQPAPVAPVNQYQPPDAVIPYPEVQPQAVTPPAVKRTTAPLVKRPVLQNISAIPAPPAPPEPPAQEEALTPEILPAAQEEPVITTTAEATEIIEEPQPDKSARILAHATPKPLDPEPVILTARTARKPSPADDLLNTPAQKPLPWPKLPPAPAPAPQLNRAAEANTQQKPASQYTIAPPVAQPQWNVPVHPSEVFTDYGNPFAALEVIELHPDKGKPKKQITGKTILKWAVILMGLVLAVLLYLIFRKRY